MKPPSIITLIQYTLFGGIVGLVLGSLINSGNSSNFQVPALAIVAAAIVLLYTYVTRRNRTNE